MTGAGLDMKPFEQRHVLRNMQRVHEILDVLARNGFGFFTDRLRSHGAGMFHRSRQKPDISSIPAPVRARKALEELGPTFVKLGQILSTRTDLLPLAWCRELSLLQDSVPPFPFSQVEQQLAKESGRQWQELFATLEPTPVAAASLAQVHAATLQNGTPVIVKVQRPDIEHTVQEDLDILEWLAQLLERRVVESQKYAPVRIVQEFRRSILSELDFTHEAAATEKMRSLFEGDATVIIPRVYPDLSSRHILTLSRIDGIKMSDVGGIRTAGLDPHIIAVNGANAYLRMIFTFGFFHADPHPGNLFACRNNAVGFVDFGLTGRLYGRTRERIADLLIALTNRDAGGVLDAFTSIGVVADSTDRENLKHDFEEYIDRYYVTSLTRLKLSDALQDAMDIIARHDIRVPSEFTLLIKTLMTVEGVARELDPDFNMVALVTPFAHDLVLERHSLHALAQELKELAATLRSLPSDTSEMLKKLSHGTLSVEVRQPSLEQSGTEIGRALRQLAEALLATALLIAGSVILTSGASPGRMQLPAIGTAFITIGGVLMLWLLFHGRR